MLVPIDALTEHITAWRYLYMIPSLALNWFLFSYLRRAKTYIIWHGRLMEYMHGTFTAN